MLKAVLFDLDGTLVQYTHNYAFFVSRMAKDWGIVDPSDPFFEAYRTNILSEGPVTLASAVENALQATGRTLPINFSSDCAGAVAKYASGIQLLLGAMKLLGLYAHLPCAIVSNGPSDMQRAAVEAAGIAAYFQQVIISGDEDVGVRKPNPEIFRIACDRLGVLPSEALMIGDNHEADILGARSFGIPAIHVSELAEFPGA